MAPMPRNKGLPLLDCINNPQGAPMRASAVSPSLSLSPFLIFFYCVCVCDVYMSMCVCVFARTFGALGVACRLGPSGGPSGTFEAGRCQASVREGSISSDHI